MLAVAAVGIPLGVVAGLLVAREGATLVAVDASGTTPTPPLAVTLGSVWTPLALVVGIGAGVLLGALVAAISLRERFPLQAEADLR
jgi:ABC-type antimicrobial peptide transport system permease subunit